jgi:hypothetical protein
MSTPDPKGFSVTPKYEPDKERMLRALRAVLEHPKRKEVPIVTSNTSGKDDGAA